MPYNTNQTSVKKKKKKKKKIHKTREKNHQLKLVLKIA